MYRYGITLHLSMFVIFAKTVCNNAYRTSVTVNECTIFSINNLYFYLLISRVEPFFIMRNIRESVHTL